MRFIAIGALSLTTEGKYDGYFNHTLADAILKPAQSIIHSIVSVERCIAHVVERSLRPALDNKQGNRNLLISLSKLNFK